MSKEKKDLSELPEKKEEKTLVVAELPKQEIRQAEGEDGEIYNLITKEEALLEILENSRVNRKILET
jgi:hypothetical protein